MTGFDGGAEDLHDEYLAATLKKAGLPEHIEIAEIRQQYGFRDADGGEWWGFASRDSAEEACTDSEVLIVHEWIITKAREATPRG